MTSRNGSLLDPGFLSRVERLTLRARRVLDSRRQGEKRSRRTGSGLLFDSHRGYVEGDDLRYLDWDLLARLDRPFMKQFQRESDLTIHLLIDRSRSMAFGRPDKFNASLRLAAVLAYIGLTSLDRVGVVMVGGDGMRSHGPVRGKGAFFSLLHFLESARPDNAGSPAAGLRMHAAAGNPGLAVMFSDFLDPELPAGLLPHIARKNELAMVQVLANEELLPPYDGDIRLVDSENGQPVEVSLGEREKQAYLSRLEENRLTLHRFAMKHGAAALRLPSDMPLEEAVWDHLLQATFVEKN
jgi:uncharacterized protein (DUF58 family)